LRKPSRKATGTAGSIAYDVADKSGALALVANGMGFALLPKHAALSYPNVAFHQLDAAHSLRFSAVWSRNVEPRLIRQRFIETLRPPTLPVLTEALT
jgi:DNA-binding transcriptional LysR family regulator